MTFPTSIQGYFGAHTTQSGANNNCVIDWKHGYIFIGTSDDQGEGTNLTKSNIFTGAEISFVDLTTYNDPSIHLAGIAPPMGLDANGDIYLNTGNGMMRIDPTTYAIDETWGTGSWPGLPPGLPDSTINGGLGGQIINIPNGTTQYMICCAIGGLFSFENIAYYMKGATFNGLDFEWTGTNQVSCSGKAGSNKAYMFSQFGVPSDTTCTFYSMQCLTGGAWVPGDWPTTNPQLSVTTIKVLAPTDIDAGWTEITCAGVCLDQTDGNPICTMHGQSAAAQQIYIVKLNAATGAVIWKCAIAGSTGSGFAPGEQWQYSRILFQTLCCLLPNESSAPPNTVVTINTSTGSSTSYTTNLAGVGVFGSQSFDDSSGAIIGSVSFNATSGSPAQLNGTPDSFEGWAAIYVAPTIVPPLASGTHASYTRIWGNYHG